MNAPVGFPPALSGALERARGATVGDPLDPATKGGPMMSAAHLGTREVALAETRQAGAELRLGSSRPVAERGSFLNPTILAGISRSVRVARAEVFGPVVSALAFDAEEEAVKVANGVAHGLSAGAWSRSSERRPAAGRRVRAGAVWLNTYTDGFPELPFGGYRQSALGRGAAEHYTETRTLPMHHGSCTAWWSGERASIQSFGQGNQPRQSLWEENT